MKVGLLFLLLPILMMGQSAERDPLQIMTYDVFFEFAAEIPSEVALSELDTWIKNNSAAEIIKMSSHADSVDTDQFNYELSVRRLENVVGLLQSKGVNIEPSTQMLPLGERLSGSDESWKDRKVRLAYRTVVDTVDSVTVTDSLTKSADDLKTRLVNAKKGDLIQIHNLIFYLNSEKIMPYSKPILDDLYEVLVDYPNLKIEIHGHICCNPNINDTRLSSRRAKYIFSYLRSKGIALNRLSYRGFGSARPIWPIPEENYEQEEINRRVEILVTNVSSPKS